MMHERRKLIRTGNYHLRLVFILIILLGMGFSIFEIKNKQSKEKVKIRIDVYNPNQKSLVKKYLAREINLTEIDYIEASVNWKQFFHLQKMGLEPAVQVEIDRDDLIDAQFHTFKEITQLVDSYANQYPNIVKLEKIGAGSKEQLPIWAMKISDNPMLDEKEPAVLFTGVHHGKEILGAEVCLYLIEYLCQHYEQEARVKDWIDETEIWIVPVVNPDAHFMIMDMQNPIHFWRKNLRDNNFNGIFEPEKDGVDLNRNYDFNWDDNDNSDPQSWHYRGPYPFSENETRTIRDLTFREKFIFNLDFHSYGEVILYPWDNFEPPPDQELIIELAGEIAKQISKRAELGHYSVRPLDGRLGQCSVWMYGKASVLSYIVEVGDSHFPDGRDIPNIVEQNAKAAFFILDRLFNSAIKGVVRNVYNKLPISAEIEITEYASPIISNPVSDRDSGFYYRIVQPGIYTVKFSAPGFRTKIIHSVEAVSDKVTSLDVELYPVEDTLPAEN